MVRYGFLPKEHIVDSWEASLRRSWPLVLPIILAYRQERNSAEIWDDFEWLAREAKPLQNAVLYGGVKSIV
jgi:hypothetical protein